MNDTGLRKAVALAGSQAELARRIGGKVKQQHVHLWLRIGVPATAILSVARAVDFEVTPHEINPDVYPNPDDGLPAARRNGGAERAAA